MASYIFLASTYATKKRKLILPLNIFSSISLVVGYFFLGAYTGMAMSIFAIVRSFLLNIPKKHSNNNLYDYLLLVLFFTSITIIAIFTYQDFYSLFAIFSTYIYTFSLWQKNDIVYKSLGIPVCLSYVCYNIFIKSVFGIICESLLLVFVIIELIIAIVKKQKSKQIINNEQLIEGV